VIHRLSRVLVPLFLISTGCVAAEAPFERPPVIRYGASIPDLQKALAGQCTTMTTRRIEPPFLPNIKDKQMQIDCEGFVFRGAPRHVEFVMGDNALKMVWLMVTAPEMDSLRAAMQARYGAPTHSNANYVAFEQDGTALRLGKGEILFYAPELQAAMAPDFTGAVFADRAAWAADLDALYAELQAKHPDLYRKHTKAEWDARHAAIRAAIATMDWPHFVIALHRFVAMAADGHTNLLSTDVAGPGFDARYTVRFFLFWDGLYVLSAPEDLKQAIGGRVVAVNGHPIAAVERALAGLTGYDSPMRAANWVQLLLSFPGNLAGLDLGAVDAPMKLTLVARDGKTIDVAVPFAPNDMQPKRLTVFDVLNNGHALPAWWSPDAPLTFNYWKDSKTVYAVFGSVSDGTKETLKQAAERLFAFVAANDVQRLIFDVRNNGGDDGRWVPTFPNARYLIGRKEYEHWIKDDGEEQKAIMADSVKPIFDAGVAEMVEMDHRISNEVRLMPTTGHTPGHVSVVIESKGETAIITGDMMHHPAQIGRPEWCPSFDSDSEAAQATRRAMLQDWADKPVLIIGTHFASPTAGRIERDGDSYRLAV
jgi:hypothetical protein